VPSPGPLPPGPLYRLLSLGLFFVWLGHALWHAIQQRQPDYLWQRLGISPGIKSKTIWLHASSVGEVALLKPLAQSLASQHPVLLTTFTATGYQHARRIMPPQVLVRVLPIDIYPLSRLFAWRHPFTLGLITETELWPETLYQVQQQGVRLVQINARLSPKSVNASSTIKRILKRTLNYFDKHLARTDQDAKYLTELGADPARIVVAGNLKYATPQSLGNPDNLIGRRYLLCASTHAGEERLLAESLLDIDSSLLIVIAPRHPQRAGEIRKSLEQFDPHLRQRSRHELISDTTRIYLADTLGEMKSLMAHAELVIMGGSFDSTGGHNVLEPAQLGKAIITGPSDFNIAQDIRLLNEHDAIIQLTQSSSLQSTVARLLKDKQARHLLGHNALSCMQQQAHIFEFYREAINAYL
jgi:3-deoxy-D-manno-octulosonic-acid transferase